MHKYAFKHIGCTGDDCPHCPKLDMPGYEAVRDNLMLDKPRMSIDALAARRRGCAEMKAAGLPCPDDPASGRSIPYERPIVRHLAYHVAPFPGGVWQRNVEQLRERINLFNGRRTVAIVTGDGLDSPDTVRRAFGGDVEDFIVMANDPKLREVTTFLSLLERCQTTAPYECTWYGHAKGVTRPANGGSTITRWVEMLYETNLDYWPLVERALISKSIAGSFKKIGEGFPGSRSAWHYSGGWYWLRNAAVFNRPTWREVDRAWTGTEAWPGLHFHADKGACLFHEATVPVMDLYRMDYFAGTVEPAYVAWQREHAHERAVAIEA